MASKVVRPRGANWTEGEKIALVEEVLKREDIIFGRFAGTGGISASGSSGVSTKDKDAAWEVVKNAVNAVSTSNKTVEQCRKQYHNIKQRVKERHDDARHPKTGGGPPAASPPPSQKLLWEGISNRPSIRGITKPLDTEDPAFTDRIDAEAPESPEATVPFPNIPAIPGTSAECTFEKEDCTEDVMPPSKRQRKQKQNAGHLLIENNLISQEIKRSIAEENKLALQCQLISQRLLNEREKHEREMLALKDAADRHRAEMECLDLRKKVLKAELDVLQQGAVLRQALSSSDLDV